MARTVAIIALTALALGISTTGIAKDKLPETSHDGLTLQKKTKLDAVYLRDGIDLSQYTKIAIEMPQIAFRKNWQRDYNDSERDITRKISDDDMANMKKGFAEEFVKVFVEELRKAGHEVTKEPADDVLELAPALVQIDVSAPSSQRSVGIDRTFTASAGQMTLYMELYDSVSGQILGRVVDTQAGRRTGNFNVTNKVTNTAAVDRALRYWAGILIDSLGEVAPPPAGDDSDQSAGP